MLKLIKSIRKSIIDGKQLIKSLVTDTIETDYDTANMLLKDKEVKYDLNKLDIDGLKIKSKFKIDDFDLEQKQGLNIIYLMI